MSFAMTSGGARFSRPRPVSRVCRSAHIVECTKSRYRCSVTRNTSFSLGDHFGDFTAEQLARGRYSNASDVVRAGLRLLEEREAAFEALRAALVEGEVSGPSAPFDFDAFIARKSAHAQ